MVLRDDVVGRAPGVALLAIAWRTLRVVPSWSTGTRRFVARVCGALLVLEGALWTVGVDARTLAGEALPDGTREYLAAGVVFVAAAWAWRTSPAVR